MRSVTETVNDAGRRSVRVTTVGLDMVGAVLWLALMVWVMRVARTPAAAAPVRDLLLVMGAVYTLSRLIVVLNAWIVPAGIVAVGTVTAVWSIGGLFGGVGSSVFGYANAAAAFHLACVAAGLMAVARLRNADARNAAVCGVIACGLVPWLSAAITSALMVLVLPVALLGRHLGTRVRNVIGWSAVAALAAVGCTAAVAATYDGDGVVDWVVAQTLSGNRGQLWQEAFDMMVANPAEGVGTNQFAQASLTARGDFDLRRAHNEFLQLGAETGLPGLGLALALLLWVFARLWVGPRDAGTAVAAAGLAAMSVAASIDYIWHFPAVALCTAALAGSGGGAGHGHGLPVPARRHRARRGNREPWVDTTLAGDALWPRKLDGGHQQDP
jgi:O-antigen ligase